jgi:ubiquinone/menaquinone biosynthesis C-methylase UbiE
MHSGSFDQAAHYYDETRGFPPGVGERVAEAAGELLAGRRDVLEVGTGTGRIARPLLARGVRVSGVDVSRKMMERLLTALPNDTRRPDLIQGAAERLPLAAGSFEAVVSVHVLHLIPDWRAALAEVRRVLRPGGLFLSGYEWRPNEAPGTRLMDQWRSIVESHSQGATNPTAGAGTHDFADIKAALVTGGARHQEVRVGEWTTTRTVGRSLEAIEHRTWSSTWGLPDDFFAACLAELRAWAVGTLGPLETELTTPHQFVWDRFEWER